MKKTYTSILGIFLITVLHAQLNFQWVKNISGIDDERSYRIATDPSGNVYTTGFYFGPTDFDPGSSIASDTAIGYTDIYVSKLDANGNYIWYKSIGGAGIDNSFGLSVDSSGGIYIAGYFHDTISFSIGTNPTQLISKGGEDIFVFKLDASNGSIIWAKSIGGSGTDIARNMNIDGHGNVFITGFFTDTVDFDPDVNIYTLTSQGSTDAFVLKLSTNGNFINAFQIGGYGGSEAYDVISDINGNIFLTGYFNDTADFDPSINFMNILALGGNDIFVAKYNASGNFVWAQQMGGTGYERGTRLALDNSGNIVLSGNFDGSVDFDPGPAVFNLASYGNEDCFIAKINSNGSLLWAKRIGGSDFEEPNDMLLDSNGNILLTGYFNGTVDFDPGPATHNLISNNVFSDIFIAKYDNSGNYQWAKSIGGNGLDVANAFTLNGNHLYVTGFHQLSVDFDPGVTDFNQVSAGGEDAYILKLTIVPSGILELENVFDFEIFPNPSNGIFSVKCNEQLIKIEIKNIAGQLIDEFREKEIALTNINRGMYYITLYTDKGIATKKIIVN